MAEYKGIKGFKVQSLASDPSPIIEGQVWYNTAGDVLKYHSLAAGTWASGGNLNEPKGWVGGAAGSVTSGIIFAGGGYPPGAATNTTATYDGTSWTEVPATLNVTRATMMGTGTQTAALTAGGSASPRAYAETYNGTSWTSITDITTGRSGCPNTGTTTAALVIGGKYPPGYNYQVLTEDWNGTSWTEVGDLNTARQYMGAAVKGTTTAGLIYGGQDLPTATYVGITESYDGTSWAETGDLGTDGYWGGSAGTQTTALLGAGANRTVKTESFDGTSWTEVADTATPRYANAFGGTANSALMMGGETPAPTATTTTEWVRALGVKTVTTS